MANHRSAGDVPRVVSDLPVQLGALAPVFQRRRIAVGLDRRGNVVLARPHSIQVDFRGDRKHKRAALELVKPIEADNSEVRARYDPEATGVLTVYVPPTEAEINEETRWSVAGLNAQLDRFRRQGIRADLRHVILGAQSLIPLVLSGAATRSAMLTPRLTSAEPDSLATLLTTAEPVGPPVDLREPLNLRGRRRPRILVLDTGLTTQAGPTTRRAEHADLRRSRLGKRLHVHLHHPWCSSNEVDATDDEDEPDDDRSGTLDFEAGHGTFIAGIVRQICPDAEIHPAGVLSSFGEGDTTRALDAIRRMTESCGPFDIVLMCFGAFFTDDDPGLFGENVRALLGDALVIAAAGNYRTCRPYFPAALPGVIGVGALQGAGRSWFSNFGPWVDASAPAIDVVSTFFDDFTEFRSGSPPRRYRQWARWSGTSFAAPKVAAAIAQEMYVNDISAPEAWRRFSGPELMRSADLGVVFNL